MDILERARLNIRLVLVQDKIKVIKEIKRRLALDVNRLSVEVINEYLQEIRKEETELLIMKKNSDNLNLAKEISNE